MNTSLTVIVPVYNEAATLQRIMTVLTEVCSTAQIVYVNDGSADNSEQILRAHARPNDMVLSKENGGKGSAIRFGLGQATGQYTVIQDADLEYDPHQISLLLQRAESEAGCAVFGSRFLQKNPNIYKRYLLGNKVLTWVLNILYGAHLTDSYTCYKLLPTDLFRSLDVRANGFELEAEITAKCLRRGVPIYEVPISYKPRRLEEGKKIRFRDAWKGIWMMLKLRFSSQR